MPRPRQLAISTLAALLGSTLIASAVGAAAPACTKFGTPANDTIERVESGEVFCARGGDDRVGEVAPGGTFVGGLGNDSVSALYGTFHGGDGLDMTDYVWGGGTFYGEGGADRVYANLRGTSALDGGLFYGGSGSDSVNIQYGRFYGGSGADKIDDNDGMVWGGAGNDRVRLNMREGTFWGGTGLDVVRSGSGTFHPGPQRSE